MKVVFIEDVQGVAQGGDVKEVKNGFARNYLIPKNLAAPATHDALQRVERLSKQAELDRLKKIKDTAALAEELSGAKVNIAMRAGAGGRLFGSVTNQIIADELAALTNRSVDRRTVDIAESIREIGVFDVNIRLMPDIAAVIKVVVHPTGTDPSSVEQELVESSEEDGTATNPIIEDEAPQNSQDEE